MINVLYELLDMNGLTSPLKNCYFSGFDGVSIYKVDEDFNSLAPCYGVLVGLTLC